MSTQTAVTLLTNPPPLLLEELVLSFDPIPVVAKRHGVDEDTLQAVLNHPIFVSRLAAVKAHHEKTGEFHRTLARYRFIEALDNAHLKAMDPRTSPKDAISYLETIASIGEIKRSQTQLQNGDTGGGFVFNIHFSGGKTVSVEAKTETPAIEGDFIHESDLPVVNVLPQNDEFEFTE